MSVYILCLVDILLKLFLVLCINYNQAHGEHSRTTHLLNLARHSHIFRELFVKQQAL